MTEIGENICAVREKIAAAAIKSGRSPGDISLVAATKMNDASRIRLAIEAGVDACGENRVQEMLEKNGQGAYEGAPLHFIGTLQKNKVRQVVGLCSLIQSVDSEALLSLIGKRASALGITQDVLIEVNVGGEQSKSGTAVEGVYRILERAASTEGVRVLGLMTVPPLVTKTGSNAEFFDILCNLFVDIRAKKYDNVSMRILSMGMSDDYEEAILHGANMVRVGTAIFGARSYNGK